ncbi:Hypoxia induced protein conserved region [Faunimonas pinastri]|uniref:Hypoxia induced protein conserved region n=1 Tax=Faunimonas pinastri TaxID=1855383 RepID=A0A1H9P3B5_9HYPH|nr:twin transmembrane helix small protein [Faunimonas pinastri]SER42405.1 Hypoxia induced protein conserved region [Faunimonas pinastri]
MSTVIIPAMIGLVFLILLAGLWNMMKGGHPNRSQKLMQMRVLAQFAAIVLIMATLWFRSHAGAPG